MSRAYGWNASLLFGFEQSYGVLPESGYHQVPFISSSLDSEQGLIESNVLFFASLFMVIFKFFSYFIC